MEFIDLSPDRRLVRKHGNPTVSTTVRKYAAASIRLTDDNYLTVSSRWTNFGNYTIEFWLNIYIVTEGDRYLCFENNIGETHGLIYTRQDGDDLLAWQILGDEENILAAALPGVGLWKHVAMVRNGEDSNMYIDGLLVSTSSKNIIPSSATTLSIGASHVNHINTKTNCHMEGIRVSRFARYDSEFLPPTAAFVYEPAVDGE